MSSENAGGRQRQKLRTVEAHGSAGKDREAKKGEEKKPSSSPPPSPPAPVASVRRRPDRGHGLGHGGGIGVLGDAACVGRRGVQGSGAGRLTSPSPPCRGTAKGPVADELLYDSINKLRIEVFLEDADLAGHASSQDALCADDGLCRRRCGGLVELRNQVEEEELETLDAHVVPGQHGPAEVDFVLVAVFVVVFVVVAGTVAVAVAVLALDKLADELYAAKLLEVAQVLRVPYEQRHQHEHTLDDHEEARPHGRVWVEDPEKEPYVVFPTKTRPTPRMDQQHPLQYLQNVHNQLVSVGLDGKLTVLDSDNQHQQLHRDVVLDTVLQLSELAKPTAGCASVL